MPLIMVVWWWYEWWYGSRGKIVLRSSVGIDRRQIQSFFSRNNGLGEAQDQIWSFKNNGDMSLWLSVDKKHCSFKGYERDIVQKSEILIPG